MTPMVPARNRLFWVISQKLIFRGWGVRSTGVPGRSGPAEVLRSERSAGSSAQRHVDQQQPVQTAHSLLLLIAPTDRSPSTWVPQHLFSSLTSANANILRDVGHVYFISAGLGPCHAPKNRAAGPLLWTDISRECPEILRQTSLCFFFF